MGKYAGSLHFKCCFVRFLCIITCLSFSFFFFFNWFGLCSLERMWITFLFTWGKFVVMQLMNVQLIRLHFLKPRIHPHFFKCSLCNIADFPLNTINWQNIRRMRRHFQYKTLFHCHEMSVDQDEGKQIKMSSVVVVRIRQDVRWSATTTISGQNQKANLGNNQNRRITKSWGLVNIWLQTQSGWDCVWIGCRCVWCLKSGELEHESCRDL